MVQRYASRATANNNASSGCMTPGQRSQANSCDSSPTAFIAGSRRSSVHSLTAEQYQAYQELEQAELLAEISRLKVIVEEEREENKNLRETCAQELMAQQDAQTKDLVALNAAHQRDTKALEDAVAKVVQENHRLSELVARLSISRTKDVDDTRSDMMQSLDARSVASLSTLASERDLHSTRQALLDVLNRTLIRSSSIANENIDILNVSNGGAGASGSAERSPSGFSTVQAVTSPEMGSASKFNSAARKTNEYIFAD